MTIGNDDLDRAVLLHPLTYLADGDEVTVGRRDIDSYAVLPADGAALIRRLADGLTPREAVDWYRETYGEQVDILDMLGALDELGFVQTPGETDAATAEPVRWQRLGRSLFSVPAWFCYGLLTVVAFVVMIRTPDLVPHYRNLFFTSSFTMIELVTFLGQFPLLLVHEGFHALAGRRLGLRSRLSIGRRLYFIVLETSLDGLVTVPRRQRILPILAGMLADVLVMAVLILAADVTRAGDGTLSLFGRLCLALSYGTLLRLIWQFYFYLRTDLFILLTTALGCVDLHTVAKGVLSNGFRRLTGRPVIDDSHWHPTDRRVARWYAWFMFAGYATTIGTFVIVVLPIAYRFLTGVLGRFFAHGNTFGGLLDSGLFLVLNLAQIVVIAAMTIRDRRRRSTTTQFQHVVG
ncbi:MAG TPA: hypothetical protein VH352_26510 [Pseudonocardiaceae bacterium]|nr:hypothetical protein [Pseudonocardiaceae bacterium]